MDSKYFFPEWPQYDNDEKEGLIRALEQGQWWRVHGQETELFEKEFAQHHGCEHALAVTNGTHALELSLLTAGIKPGDEVIVPSFTFISTAMAVQRVGGTPVLADVDLDNYCLCPKATEQAITDKTKAIIPVHMCGHFADMEAFNALAAKYDLTIIQDSAHAHGARGQQGRSSGEWGSMACFSFQNFKLMTAGEGGLLLCPDQETFDRAYVYANCGRVMNDKDYKHTVCGSNYRMGEFSAAVLRAQLSRLDSQTKAREANAKLMNQAFSDIPDLIIQGHQNMAQVHPHYMYMFRLNDDAMERIGRTRVVDKLVELGIPAYRAYKALHRVEAYWQGPHKGESETDLAASLKNSDAISDCGVWLHHRVLLGNSNHVEFIADSLKTILKN
ncbi:MAG: DegT/DnrJ/EryC1/StrS family aminotransferase [Aestuariibacter sp.]